MRRQKPYKIVFKDISKFEEQNPIIGSLLGETEAGKLTDESINKFLNSVHSTWDLEIKSGLGKLRNFNRNLALKDANANVDSDDNNDNDDNSDSNGNEDLPFDLPEVPKH